MMKNNYKIIFLFLLVCFACGEQTALEKALMYAGENRLELEKVLKHYEQDSLKLKAAEFLIMYMPGHYSYADTSYYNQLYVQMDSVAALYKALPGPEKEEIYFNFLEQHIRAPRSLREDTHFISADYLIRSIDDAFHVWQSNEWNRQVDFETFCEYILPYKVMECQELDNWREYFYDLYNGDLDMHPYCELYRYSTYATCITVSHAMGREIQTRLWSHELPNPVKKLSLLTQAPVGDCYHYNILTTGVMRAKGVPCGIDFIPQWPFRNMRHSWNVIVQNSGKHVILDGFGTTPGMPHKEYEKMAKVFRYTYASNQEIEELLMHEKRVPDFIRNRFFKDVTEEYIETTDISLSLKKMLPNKYAYLAVFDNQQWVPTHWGKIKNKKVVFGKMGKDIVYLPVIQDAGGLQAIADPVHLTIKGEQKTLTPDTMNRQTLKLIRKYPAMQNVYNIGRRVIGGCFQASNDPLFHDADTLHRIEKFGILPEEINVNPDEKEYRYWRYLSPEGSFGNMAEIVFYSRETNEPIRGEIIGTPGSLHNDPTMTKETVFDRNILTFFDVDGVPNPWVGMDFGEPVGINKILYYPRSDGNMIEIGDEYELLYWGEGEWQSMGKQIAEQVVLTYEKCPTNALFLLRNLTKGKEERIFTYENEEQIWW